MGKPSWIASIVVVLAWAGLEWSGFGSVRADHVILRGGGTLREVAVVPDPDRDDYRLIYTTTGSSPLAFHKDRLESVTDSPTPLKEYLARKATLDDSAEAHFELGLWCEDQKLTGPAQAHFRKAVEVDSEFGPAREKLGHVFINDRWMTFDEVREFQGLVKHNGRWITPHKKEEQEIQALRTAEQEVWNRHIQLVLKRYRSGTVADQFKAEEQLREIQDPNAIVPLVNQLAKEAPALRHLLNEILGTFPEPEATHALVHRLLADDDRAVRQSALTALARRQDAEAIERLVRALKDDDPEIAGRAAWALAGLDAKAAVPHLIPVLTSIQKRVETRLVPTPVGGGGGGGMNLGVGFGSVGPGFVGATGQTFAELTGPAVAPGAVAFGARAVPFPTGSALSVGGGGGGRSLPSVVPVPRQVVVSHQVRNVEVLNALERLTGRDFGYNRNAWRRWLQTEFELPDAEDLPRRVVPQP